MASRRPTPLSDDLIEVPTAQAIASGRGVTLLGRVSVHSPFLKPGESRMRTPMRPSSLRHTPKCFLNALPTPLNSVTSSAPIRWLFTPMATPSPCARLLDMEEFRLAGITGTPVASPRGTRGVTAAAVAARVAVGSWADWSSAMAEEAQAQAASDEDNSGSGSDGEAMAVHAGPPPPPGAAHPSIGSTDHASGTCKRCCFFPCGRCTNGYDCPFCHYEHEKPKRQHRSRRGGKRGPDPVAVVKMPLQMQAMPSGTLLPRPLLPYPGGTWCLVQPMGMSMSMPYGMPMPSIQPSVIALEPALMPVRAI